MVRRSLELSPVTPSGSNAGKTHRPVLSISTRTSSSDRPLSPEKKAFHDSNTFLTALASQERRVLELKEELHKAETKLEKLKRQWTTHEAARKRNELRQLEPLQPLDAPSIDITTLGDSDAAREIREQENRKSKPLTTRQSHRTVFSGSRHTKTLSLLSPSSTLSDPPYRKADLPMKTRRGTTDGPPQPSIVPKTLKAHPSSPFCVVDPGSRQSVRGLPKDDIVETGKQFVGDLREGLWNFIEDLRQATVGEELATSSGKATRNHTSNRKPEAGLPETPLKHDSSGPTSFSTRDPSLRTKSSGNSTLLADAETVFDVATIPLATKSNHQRRLTIQTTPADPDGWDTWEDSPPRLQSQPQSSTSSQTDSTDRSTPRTSTSSSDATPRPVKAAPMMNDRKEIPWPVLTKLSPGNLKRTASNLMSEWESSLTPPVESDDTIFSSSRGGKSS